MLSGNDPGSEAPSDFRGRILDGRIRLQGWREVEASWIRFDAIWLQDERPAAVYLLDPEGDNADEMAATICGQELCVGLPEHPAVLTTLASGWTEDGFHWLATEKPPSSTLPDNPGPIPPDLFARWGRRLLEALVFLEENEVVHASIRPQAILLEPRTDEIVLGGFSDRTQLLQLGAVAVASPSDDPYASPEQIAGGRVDLGTDMFSLGLLLYVLATGLDPAAARRELHRGEATGRIPDALFELLSRMAASERGNRVASAKRARAEFELAASELEALDPRPDERVTQRWRRISQTLASEPT
mgnify:CR=1 FL=1